MRSSKVCSRLKAQLTKFTAECSKGLNRPLQNFVGEILFGVTVRADSSSANCA